MIYKIYLYALTGCADYKPVSKIFGKNMFKNCKLYNYYNYKIKIVNRSYTTGEEIKNNEDPTEIWTFNKPSNTTPITCEKVCVKEKIE